MPKNSLRLILILGALAISGILVFQSYWLFESWSIKNQEFHTSVSKALRIVAEKIADINETDLPKSNLIQRRSSNYYSVNINSAIDANILEDFLVREFDIANINTIFEYAVYDCENNELAYANTCNLSEGPDNYTLSENLPTFDELIYYFVVNFPKKESYIINDIRMSVLFSLLTILAVVSFMYAVWIILKQQKTTDLQKDFINNMTHEFKTPISSIKIASDVLLKNENVIQDVRLNQYAGIIKDQNERLNNQVEKVLNIARLEKDQFKLNLERIELISFINKIVGQEKIKFETLNGELKFLTKITSAEIKADKLHFTNVLTNILDNASKYCKKRPEVLISLKLIKDKYRLEITDNGIGMKKEQLKKIFNKFYRVSTGNVHDVKGFGLGLFYVKNICDVHGWNTTVESTLNQGTSFIIEIPEI